MNRKHFAVRLAGRLGIIALVVAAVASSQLRVGHDPLALDGAQPVGARLRSGATCPALQSELRRIGRDLEAEWAKNAGHLYGRAVSGGIAVDQTFSAGGAPVPMPMPPAQGVVPITGIPDSAPLMSPDGGPTDSSGVSRETAGVVSTNLQELGVDEPDLIKTDGEMIYALADGMLVAFRADPLQRVGRLQLNTWASQMFLAGDRVVLFTDGGPNGLRIVVVDTSQPSSMTVAATLDVDGYLQGARMVDGFIRVVVTKEPYVRYGGPEPRPMPFEGNRVSPPGPAVDGITFEESQDLFIDPNDQYPGSVTPNELRPVDVIPKITITRDGDTTVTRTDCEDVHVSQDPDAVTSTTVFSLDPADPKPLGSVTALAGGGIVYSSPTNLYLARTVWSDEGGPTTEVHRFDIRDPRATAYRGVGTVDGTPLNQWSLGEHDGHIRIATTIDTFGGVREVPMPGTTGLEFQAPTSQSQVAILRLSPDGLTQVGVVDGLGVDERIYAVRFIGDLAYVVTFRQTDPLYVLDLSDPTAPRAVGELKIPGFSAYLHPVGDGLLLGIGQDATLEGQRLGVKVSLFDVRDPRAPKQLDTLTYAGYSSTPIEYDSHAFTFLPERNVAVIPVTTYDEQDGTNTSAARLVRVVDGRLGALGAISHAQAEVMRSIAIDDTLYTMSFAGLRATDLDELSSSPLIAWR